MKHKFVYLRKIFECFLITILALFILTSCQQENNFSSDYEYSDDSLTFLPEYAHYFGYSVVFDGKLYIADSIQQPVSYIERETMKLETLCRKQECTHNSKSCLSDSKFYTPSSYQVVDGILYTHGTKYNISGNNYLAGIYKIEGEQLIMIAEWERDRNSITPSFDYADGYFYFFRHYKGIENDLCRVKADGTEEIEMLSGAEDNHNFVNLKISDGYLYYSEVIDRTQINLYRSELTNLSKRERILENINAFQIDENSKNVFSINVDSKETGESSMYSASLAALNKNNKIISDMFNAPAIFYKNICVYISKERNGIIYTDINGNKQLRKIKENNYAPTSIYYASNTIAVCYDRDNKYSFFYYELNNDAPNAVKLEVIKQ